MSKLHSARTSPPCLLRRHLTGASQKSKVSSTSHIPNHSPREAWQPGTELPGLPAVHGKVRGALSFCTI